MNWFIILPILIGASCFLLGYLMGKKAFKNQHKPINADVWKNKVAKLENDLKMCQASKQLIPFNSEKAEAVFGKKITENDLTIIKRIGPQTVALFALHHIRTWKALSEVSVETCREILDSSSKNHKIYNPSTWPEQAKLAYEGNWKALLEWQKEM
ncbi:hypothetical protein [Bizionia myxarmorum]|uniref:DUF4332 domain-containing protein n=1 Tax=Bizionia myxarmorum TaxID=291186 RepID=A0A5D0RD32_9FLAO|nr:hypothetical protein [Bizionia myxarmorum]TYB78628.1 hypothetical protein ES674_02280 [Bizionia myxarmorum]